MCLIGGGVALAVHTLVFPPDPVVGVARATNAVFGELGALLRDAAGALAGGDVLRGEAAARAAEAVEVHVGELRHAVARRQLTRLVGLRCGAVRGSSSSATRASWTTWTSRLAARGCSCVTSGSTCAAGVPPQPELADAIRDLGLAAWELPAQFEEPWRGGDVLRIALQSAGRATAAATREPIIALNDIAGQVRSIAIDIVRASEASETDHGAIAEAPTEELLAALPLPEPVAP